MAAKGTVRIVTDSSSDLTDEEAAEHGIEIVPLTIRFGDEEFTDRKDLTPEDFYARMAASDKLPETAAPPPGAFEQVYEKLVGEGASTVICINLSSDLSATMQSAETAAKSVAGDADVRVLDSRSITGGLGLQVLEAAKAAEAGRSADDVVALVADMSTRVKVYAALDTLENLRKGGRIGGAQAMLGSILSIKPCIDVSTGKVAEAAKPRTRKKALQWVRDKTLSWGAIEHVNVLSALAPDYDEFVSMFTPPLERSAIRTGSIGAVIGTHAGPAVAGTCFLAPR